MQAGNAHYIKGGDLPACAPVFPLEGALLLPGGRLPLNIFEPRYLAMVDAAMSGDRLIGMIQPAPNGEPALCEVGCLGRITSLAETGDGRYLIALDGVCRFRVLGEEETKAPFRQCRIAPFLADLDAERGADQVDRPALIRALRDFLAANEMQADWRSIEQADNVTLVNSLSMMAPYGPAEKQALLEAPDLKSRAEMLVALTEMVLAKGRDDFSAGLQ